MQFSELMKSRRSVRSYLSKQVEEEKVSALIEAVRLSPSASNSQPWKLIIVDDPHVKDQVAKATFSSVVSFNKFATQAPLLAVLTLEKPKIITQIGGMIKDREFPLMDIGIAASNLCLQAADLGLGSCMLGWFNEEKIQQLLGVPHTIRIGLVITLGYENVKERNNKVRKKKEDMCCFNSYG